MLGVLRADATSGAFEIPGTSFQVEGSAVVFYVRDGSRAMCIPIPIQADGCLIPAQHTLDGAIVGQC